MPPPRSHQAPPKKPSEKLSDIIVINDFPPTLLDINGQIGTRLLQRLKPSHDLLSTSIPHKNTDEQSLNYQKDKWTRQERRAYQRILSGLYFHRGSRLRFFTLTTPPNPKRPLNEAWKVLYMRLKRKGFIRAYFKVITSEGQHGVIHVLYFGSFIPHWLLSKWWEEIIGAKIVDIRACKSGIRSAKRLARYVVSQYIVKQRGFKRFSWSWGWVFKGFVKYWRAIVEASKSLRTAIIRWTQFLNWMKVSGVKPPPLDTFMKNSSFPFDGFGGVQQGLCLPM